MNTEQWRRVKDILDEVLDLPDEDQAAYVAGACPDDAEIRRYVERLLEADAHAPAFLDVNAAALLDSRLSELDHRKSNEYIGPYRIIERLGHGGMSAVYLAQHVRDQDKQYVAIKVLDDFFQTEQRIARFRAEQQILAALSHPNVAHLHEGGFTERGYPYLVMEYVEGIAITEYCTRHERSIEERLRLLQDVIRAVQYAHQNLIVHRDLKPSNILVTADGTVKLLDFGIAKLLREDAQSIVMPSTRTGEHLMTPGYASPEQIRGEPITTATDVYQLGVLAHELLTGTRPFQTRSRSLAAIEKAVLDGEPDRPSTVALRNNEPETARELKGDLDTIVLKALRQDPSERYSSAGAICDDIQRYLDGQPIMARPATLAYRVSTFIRRNRSAVTGASLILLLLIGYAITVTFQANRIAIERDRAHSETERAEAVAGYLSDLFQISDPTETQGYTFTSSEILDRGVTFIDRLDDQAEVQADLLDVLGRVYRRIGKYDRSQDLLSRAVALRREHQGPGHEATARSLDHLGLLLSDRGRLGEAEDVLREALAIRTDVHGSEHVSTTETMNRLAYALRRQGQYDEAEHLFRESLRIREAELGRNDLQTVASLSSLGTVLHVRGRFDSTEVIYREVLDRRRSLLGPSHPDLAMSLNNLGTLLMNIGQYDEAISLLNEGLDMRLGIFGHAHPKVALTMNNLALALRDKGEFEEAEPLFYEALAQRRALLDEEHLSTALSLYSLGGHHLLRDRPEQAHDYFREALSIFEQRLPEDHSFVARARIGLGRATLESGRVDEATGLIEQGYTDLKRIHADASLEHAVADIHMGSLQLERGNTEAARVMLERGYETLRSIEATESSWQAHVRQQLGTLTRMEHPGASGRSHLTGVDS